MSAATKPQLGDQRYLAVWCDAEAVKADARKNGWTDDSGTGPLDYTDHAQFEWTIRRGTFEGAVAAAVTKVSADYWGAPRVYLQEFGPADVPAAAREWEDVKFWDIEADGTATEQTV